MPWKRPHGKPGRVHSVTRHAVDIVANKKFKGTIVRRINVHPEHTMYFESPKNVLRNREAEEEGNPAQLRHQPALL